MSSAADDTMWICTKCTRTMWPEYKAAHLEWHAVEDLNRGEPECSICRRRHPSDDRHPCE